MRILIINAVKVIVLNNRYPSKKKPFVASYVKSLGQVIGSLGVDVTYLVDTGNSDSRLGQIIDLIRYNLKILFSAKLGKAEVLVINHFQLFWKSLKSRINKGQVLIFHWHGSEIKGSVRFQNFQRWNRDDTILKGMHVFPSLYFKNLVLEKVPALTNWKVIPTGGVDMDLFKQQARKPKGFLNIGFAGHLRKEKGVGYFISLIKESQELQVACGIQIRFSAIDYGDHSGAYSSVLRTFSNVELLSPRLKNEMPEFYQSLDLLIFPTRSESLGLVPLEAMACGVPVICPNDFACPEYCVPNISGELFQPNDYNSFKSSVIGSLQQIRRYRPAEVVDKNYSQDVVRKKYREVFQELNLSIPQN